MAAFGGTPIGPGGRDPAMMMPSPAGGMAPMLAPPTDATRADGTKQAGSGPDRDLTEKLKRWSDPLATKNIADELSAEVLAKIGDRVLRDFKIDELSRKDWMTKSEDAIKLAMQVAEEKTSPWPNCCYSLDTDILTKDGWKAIGDVTAGESVLSRAPDGTADYYPITQTFRHTASHVVHFEGKSIDMMVTPNHRMLVEDRNGNSSFIEAGEFVKQRINHRSIPLISFGSGKTPELIHGLNARAYLRFLGWFIAEGTSRIANKPHVLKTGEKIVYPGFTSLSVAQSKKANPRKYMALRADIEACGFSYKAYDDQFIIHATSMSDDIKRELRSLGRAPQKYIPQHVMALAPELLSHLLETLIEGDGCIRRGYRNESVRSHYDTTSRQLADQVQELCQRLGMRGTISVNKVAGEMGGVIGGRQIVSTRACYRVAINTKRQIDCSYLSAKLIQFGRDVACVEVAPHHTVYVRRNGKAIWCGNSNVVFPLMTVAAIQFNARSYPAIVQGRNVVKGVVIGRDDGEPVTGPDGRPVVDPHTQQVQWKTPPGEKLRRAKRVADHMSWQLIEEQTEWEEDTDKLLLILPIIGCCFRKTYFAPELGRNASALVNPKKLVVNYWARSMETAPRVSEIVEYYPNEVEEKIRAGLFVDQDYKVMGASSTDEDAPIEFVEQHRLWDLDDDGYEEPYIVTAHKTSGKVARVVAGYEAEGVIFDGETHEVARIQREHYYTKYDFIPNPDGGFYGVGFGQLLGPINDSVNTVINMLIDAGTLSINGGGFIGRGFSLHGGSLRRKMGEWTFVNAPGGAIRDAIVPLTPPEPSQVLFTLLGSLVEAGKEIASVKDVLTGGDAGTANMQPTTLLALIEQGLKVFTAIFKRIHRAAKREYDKQYRLNSIYLEEQASYRVGDDWRMITRADYLAGSGVVPASDPSMVSDMQRLAHAQFLQGYQNDPLCNPIEIRRRVFDAAQTEDVDKIINPNPPPNPDLIAKAAELELKGQSERVTQIKDLAQAVLYIAQADKASNSQNVDWATHQLAVVKFMVESLTGQGQQGAANGDAGPEPADGPAPGLGGPSQGDQPPIPDARKAPDGKWYVPDAARPGKFNRVETNAA